MEFKQNKSLPPEKQIMTANPDVNIVGAMDHAYKIVSFDRAYMKFVYKSWYIFGFQQVELCDDDDFIVLACDGIWYESFYLCSILYLIIIALSEKNFFRKLYYSPSPPKKKKGQDTDSQEKWK